MVYLDCDFEDGTSTCLLVGICSASEDTDVSAALGFATLALPALLALEWPESKIEVWELREAVALGGRMSAVRVTTAGTGLRVLRSDIGQRYRRGGGSGGGRGGGRGGGSDSERTVGEKAKRSKH
jgi:hypothetical protein